MATMTIAEYAALRGVSPATIEWFTTDPDTRPVSLCDAEVPRVYCSLRSFARLWGCGLTAVQHQCRKGVIVVQACERELIRLGHLQAEGIVEAQLACTARSPEWWRRNRPRINGKDRAPEDSDRAIFVSFSSGGC